MLDLKKGKYWDLSWSPVTGCAKHGFGKGCLHCWGGHLTLTRLSKHKAYQGVSSPDTPTRWNGVVHCHEDRLKLPKGKSKVIALNWMGELFNPAVPDSFIMRVFTLMMLRQQHTFLLLTKVPERLVKFMKAMDPVPGAVEHIWFGTSAATQREWNRNVGHLLQISNVKRWVSLEPMIEEVDILTGNNPFKVSRSVRAGKYIDWIAMGAESGARARPMKLNWAENVIADGQEIGVPIFYKQGPDEHGSTFVKAPDVFGSKHLKVPFEVHKAA